MNPLTAIRGAVCVSTPAIRRQPVRSLCGLIKEKVLPNQGSMAASCSGLRNRMNQIGELSYDKIEKVADDIVESGDSKAVRDLVELKANIIEKLIIKNDLKLIKEFSSLIRGLSFSRQFIHLCVDREDEEMLRTLFENGARIAPANDLATADPFLYAIDKGQMSIASLMLEHPEYDVNGLYPYSHEYMRGVASFHPRAATHQFSPLAIALRNKEEGVVDELFRMGAKLDSPLMSDFERSRYYPHFRRLHADLLLERERMAPNLT